MLVKSSSSATKGSAAGLRLAVLVAATSSAMSARAGEPAEEEPITDVGVLDLDLEDLLAIPLVESVSLRDQSLHEAPSSVTVIREDQIKASGATTLPELLRLVPGMHVMQLSANNFSIGLRGISRLVNDRVLILLNGHPYKEYVSGEIRSIYVDPMDVERIEVIRGPGSVIYGAGALSGVVNIITKKPGRNGTIDASSWGGIGSVRSMQGSDAYLQNSGGARVVYNLQNAAKTLGARLGLSMNHQAEWPNDDVAASPSTTGAAWRAPYGYSVFASGQYAPTGDLRMNAELVHAAAQDVGVSDMSNVPVNTKTSMQQVLYRVERKRLLFDHLDASFAIRGRHARGESPPATTQAVDYYTNSVDSMLRLTLGVLDNRNITTAAYQLVYAHTANYFCSPTLLSNGIVLDNDTYLFRRRLVLSLGGRFDGIVSKDDLFGEIVYRVLSYRGTLTWRFNQDHAVRVSASSSFRVPTPYETFASVLPTADLASLPAGLPPIRFVVGNPKLVPEQVLNFELGYRGKLLRMVQADVAAFGQDVAHLIANDPANGLPVFKVNRFSYQQLGLEVGLKVYPTATASSYLNYSLVYSRDKDTNRQIKEFPMHIAGLGGEVRLPWRTRLNLDSYWVFAYAPDVTLLTPGAQVPALTNEKRNAADQMYLSLRVGHLLYQDKVEVFLIGKNLTGFFREARAMRTYPMENVQPIGATIMAGVSVNGS